MYSWAKNRARASTQRVSNTAKLLQSLAMNGAGRARSAGESAVRKVRNTSGALKNKITEQKFWANVTQDPRIIAFARQHFAKHGEVPSKLQYTLFLRKMMRNNGGMPLAPVVTNAALQKGTKNQLWKDPLSTKKVVKNGLIRLPLRTANARKATQNMEVRRLSRAITSKAIRLAIEKNELNKRKKPVRATKQLGKQLRRLSIFTPFG